MEAGQLPTPFPGVLTEPDQHWSAAARWVQASLPGIRVSFCYVLLNDGII